ncbi:hypothetical protein VD0002_g5513 [Verticillium dahliae]|uniref:Major facilitator superfamily (MFS) profile domain-containing protein n=2 Tax=Verticillium dahliae TaxID=27337 RepID=G2XEZ7_VERDV|nr:uncharacterized protein VDAG_08729 [Verticillium dahliae VdLs.17]KAF3348867.1 Maltose permease MAL31 [Verticillium dahliae VDG2]KAH6686501.1 major facilitator superfamily domain-containing protein [Verticillium dahliae]EGY18395.1 hypothetical protein VDAG_08729 [Verticillium dahliae VdLs.17]PNH34741.1 hypothetical protein BJF96_g2217 [Verticillium dahliae]PNH62599.1 hypothetical protein VD0002_g5513 [Verticillium dahliae]
MNAQTPPAPAAATWASLPRKSQLFILFLCRAVDFLQVASLQAYIFFQLKSFDAGLSDAAASAQAGVLQGCFSGAQVVTAVLWGKASDAPWAGRKVVIMTGLMGTALSCVGYAFVKTFAWAIFWRIVGGGINGTVGAVRTMVAENVSEKRFQSRAFLLLPLSFNVANVIGPPMGGLLADAPTTLPRFFGRDAIFGFRWIQAYPYALPSLLNAVFLTLVSGLLFFCLEETSPERKDRYDLGLAIAARIRGRLSGAPSSLGYSRVETSDLGLGEEDSIVLDTAEVPATNQPTRQSRQKTRQKLPFHRIWTRNVILILLTTALFEFQLGAFANLWPLFLSTPRPASGSAPLGGGLAFSAPKVGLGMSLLGLLGLPLQLALYPSLQARLGTLRSYRYFLPLFSVAYLLAPMLAVLPPAAMGGLVMWVGIALVAACQVLARTFTMPAGIMLLNNGSPHPSVLGTIHGLGQSVAAGFRTVGPVASGWLYGMGLNAGNVIIGWWGVAGVAVLCSVSALWVYEGTGHEIVLEGEEE